MTLDMKTIKARIGRWKKGDVLGFWTDFMISAERAIVAVGVRRRPLNKNLYGLPTLDRPNEPWKRTNIGRVSGL